MSTRADEAVNRKHCGHNCSQAVACAFCDYTGLDEEALKETTQAFAVGMGTMEGNCGALTGAGIVLGLANKDPRKTFSDVRNIMSEFKDRNGTVICKELKGIETGHVVRECDDCIRDAVEFLEERLQK